MWVCVRGWEREKEREYETDRESKRKGKGSPWGLINQACIEREGPGGSCMGRQVSIAFWGRGYGQTHQSSHNTHAETQAELKLPRDKTHFLLLYLITMSQPPASYFVLFLNVKYCCDQIMRANGNVSRFCKQFIIDFTAAYCVSLCFPFSL